MNIGDIAWPEDPKAACRLYLEFDILVIEKLGIKFPEALPSPLRTAKSYVAGEVTEEDYGAQNVLWWRHVDATGGTQEFRDIATLTARLAICLLSATTDRANSLGDDLSWFFEVLGFMGFDLNEPFQMMTTHFPSRTAK